MARIESDGSGFNTYDCRICRRERYNVDSRVCLFDRPSAVVSNGGDAYIPVDADTATALCADNPGGNLLAGFRRWQDRSGRELCFVPCVRREAQELLASEIDAKEYGWNGGEPTRRKREAFRVIRAEKAGAENERIRDMRKKHGGGH